MATPAVTPQAATAWDEQGNPVQAQQPPATGATAWDEQGNPVQQQQQSDDANVVTEIGKDALEMGKNVAKMAAAPATHLASAVKALAHGDYHEAAGHFINSLSSDPAADIVDSQLASSKQAAERMIESGKKGDALGVAQHAAGVLPGASQVDAAMTAYQQEPSRKNLAHVISSSLPVLVPGALKIGGEMDMLPSSERAGQSLEEVKSIAGDVPLQGAKLGKVQQTVSEMVKQGERGADLPPAVSKLAKRLESGDPIKYEEAKDFQSNISALSAEEKMAMKPNTKRLVGQLNQDLKSALEEAADTQGKGQQFVDAMKEYHNAMKVKGWTENAKTAAWKAALTAGGVYGLAKIFGKHEF